MNILKKFWKLRQTFNYSGAEQSRLQNVLLHYCKIIVLVFLLISVVIFLSLYILIILSCVCLKLIIKDFVKKHYSIIIQAFVPKKSSLNEVLKLTV